MLPKSEKNRSQRDRILQIAQQGGCLSHSLERGQSNAPLSDTFASIENFTHPSKIHLSLLCLSGFDLKKTLHWLTHGGQDNCQVRKSENGRLLVDFPELNLCVLVASPERLMESAANFQEFVRSAGSLTLVCRPDEPLQRETIDLIRDLEPCFQLVRSIVIGNMSGSEEADENGGPLLPRRFEGTSLPTLFLRESDSLDVKSLMIPSELADQFAERDQATKLLIAIQALSGRIARTVATARINQAKIEEQFKACAGKKNLAGETGPLSGRERVSEGLALLEKDLILASERAIQPLGRLTALVREVVGNLHIEDLEREYTTSTVKLSVNARHLAMINRQIENVLREDLARDLAIVNQRTRELCTLSTTDSRSGMLIESMPFNGLKTKPIWYSVENLISIGKASHIELARRGLFDVLTAGRQRVFMIIMFVSMMGRMGLPKWFESPSSSAGFGLFMAMVMISSMVNAVLNWRRENHLQSTKEMDKIRESLISDGSKVVEQVEKLKLSAIREFIKEAGKQFEGHAKRIAEQRISFQKSEVETTTLRLESSRKVVENQLREWTEGERLASKLVAEARAMQAVCIDNQRQSVAEFAKSFCTPSFDSATSLEKLPSIPVVKSSASAELRPKTNNVLSTETVKPAKTSGLAERRVARQQLAT